jgi:hypothetical protein
MSGLETRTQTVRAREARNIRAQDTREKVALGGSIMRLAEKEKQRLTGARCRAFPHTPSFLRKQESSLSGFPTASWIPACAGMTGKNKSGGGRGTAKCALFHDVSISVKHYARRFLEAATDADCFYGWELGAVARGFLQEEML